MREGSLLSPALTHSLTHTHTCQWGRNVKANEKSFKHFSSWDTLLRHTDKLIYPSISWHTETTWTSVFYFTKRLVHSLSLNWRAPPSLFTISNTEWNDMIAGRKLIQQWARCNSIWWKKDDSQPWFLYLKRRVPPKIASDRHQTQQLQTAWEQIFNFTFRGIGSCENIWYHLLYKLFFLPPLAEDIRENQVGYSNSLFWDGKSFSMQKKRKILIHC